MFLKNFKKLKQHYVFEKFLKLKVSEITDYQINEKKSFEIKSLKQNQNIESQDGVLNTLCLKNMWCVERTALLHLSCEKRFLSPSPPPPTHPTPCDCPDSHNLIF